MRLEHDSTEGSSQTGLTGDEETLGDFDEDCPPTRLCRNAREFSFDGFAENGEDLQTAWRERLARERPNWPISTLARIDIVDGKVEIIE